MNELSVGVSNLKAELYNILYTIGVSSNPKEVIVGKDGWLYANQLSKQTIITNNEEFKKSYNLTAININRALEEWRLYFAKIGVKEVNILIVPDKRSIYPEFLPLWAVINSREPINALINQSDSKKYGLMVMHPLWRQKLIQNHLYFIKRIHN